MRFICWQKFRYTLWYYQLMIKLESRSWLIVKETNDAVFWHLEEAPGYGIYTDVALDNAIRPVMDYCYA